jgi:hypothetical protein
VFINKLYAMSMISLMTTAYPKIVYDKTRIAKWDNRVGAAIPVQGGDVNSVARIIDPAQISPQIAQFIQLAVHETQANLGATSVALGDARPDNTSAIIALQKAAAVPNELTRQNLYLCIEELGRIYLDFMGEYYGMRAIGDSLDKTIDFSVLKKTGVTLKLDVGASSYWSEIASMQTLDNLMMRGKLDLIDYLERVPDGYIITTPERLDKLKSAQQDAQSRQAGAPGPGAAMGGLTGAPMGAMMGMPAGAPMGAPAGVPAARPNPLAASAGQAAPVMSGAAGRPQVPASDTQAKLAQLSELAAKIRERMAAQKGRDGRITRRPTAK